MSTFEEMLRGAEQEDERFAGTSVAETLSDAELDEIEQEIAESKARHARWEAEDLERRAADKRKAKVEPTPKVKQPDPEEEQFQAETAKQRVAEIEQQFGPNSAHAKRARAEYVEQQEQAFKAQQDEFDRSVRAAAATDVRRRIEAEVRAERDTERKSLEQGLASLKDPLDRRYYLRSFDERHSDEWMAAEIEARTQAKLRGFETGLVERDTTVIDHTKPRPLNATERVLAQQALNDRETAAYADKVLGPDWKKRL